MENSSLEKRKFQNSGTTMKGAKLSPKEAERGVKKTGDKRQTKVKVVIRVRPPLTADSRVCVGVAGSKVEIFNHRNIRENLQYEFSSVYDSSTCQKEIFEGCVKPLISNAISGENVSIFAYGPTGAGKTYTMLGTEEDPGMIPRVIRTLFLKLGSSPSTSSTSARTSTGAPQSHTVSFSYLEIYNEKVQDLLNPSETDLPIREDGSHNIFVAGLTQKVIHSFQDFKNLFGPASNNRTVAATKLNERSSRSHCIVQLLVNTRRGGKLFRGKIYLVDLAGSEDNRRTGNSGLRLKESGAINKSLFVLGEVVDAINNHLPRIPYRNSKLTRLLQDSIGGSCHSVMVTNVAPEESFYYDTYCTLNFATKSRKIINTNTTSVSIDRPSEPMVKALKRTHSDTQLGGSNGKRAKLSPKTGTCADPHNTSGDTAQVTGVPPIVPLVVQRQDKLEQTVKGCMKKMEDLVQQLNMKASSSSSSSSSSNKHHSSTTTSTKPDPTMAEIQRQLSEVQAQLKEIQQQQQEQQKSTESKSQPKSTAQSKSQHKPTESKSQHKSTESKSQDGDDKSSSSSLSLTSSSLSSSVSGEGKKGEPRRRSLRKAMLSADVPPFDSVLKDKTNTVIQSSRTKAAVPAAGGRGGLVMQEELSCSPLFLAPPNPKRFGHKGFKSTALEAGKTSSTSNKVKAEAANFSHPQGKMNEEMLEVLNTAPVKRLQELHTVGVKRARLIYDWRETHGHFASFEELKQIPGFTEKYVHSLLQRNFILTDA